MIPKEVKNHEHQHFSIKVKCGFFKGKIVRDGKRCDYIKRDRETVFQVNDTALEKLIKDSV